MYMDKLEYLQTSYNYLRSKGIVHTKKDFAAIVGVSQPQMSKALSGDEKNLTNPLIQKVQQFMDSGISAVPADYVQDFPSVDSSEEFDKKSKLVLTTFVKRGEETNTLPLLPIEAMAGTLGEFIGSVSSYDCERIISPIKGVDYAIKIYGDSMSPAYNNGDTILIKKIDPTIFVEWNRVYVLDTPNGAVIKQVRETNTPGVVECVSINPAYQPFTIDTTNINGWYKVLMVLSLK